MRYVIKRHHGVFVNSSVDRILKWVATVRWREGTNLTLKFEFDKRNSLEPTDDAHYSTCPQAGASNSESRFSASNVNIQIKAMHTCTHRLAW